MKLRSNAGFVQIYIKTGNRSYYLSIKIESDLGVVAKNETDYKVLLLAKFHGSRSRDCDLFAITVFIDCVELEACFFLELQGTIEVFHINFNLIYSRGQPSDPIKVPFEV